MDCYRSFNVDIMKFYISALDQARKLKFSNFLHLLSINKMFQYVGEVFIFELGRYISALGHVRELILI